MITFSLLQSAIHASAISGESIKTRWRNRWICRRDTWIALPSREALTARENEVSRMGETRWARLRGKISRIPRFLDPSSSWNQHGTVKQKSVQSGFHDGGGTNHFVTSVEMGRINSRWSSITGWKINEDNNLCWSRGSFSFFKPGQF